MAGSMTKAELLGAVADSVEGVSKADAERVLSVFFDTVATQAKKGNKVSWPGFGSFSTSKRKARTGRNPQTGEPVKIAASTAMKFSASAALKASLNAKKATKKKAAKKAKTASKKKATKKKAAKKR